MWLTFMVIFAALSPGVLFTIPSLGKKMGGKVVIAAMHAVLFVIVVNLLYVSEGFAAGSSKTSSSSSSQETALIKAQIAYDAAVSTDNNNIEKEIGVEKQIRDAIAASQNNLNALNTLLKSNTFLENPLPEGATISSSYNSSNTDNIIKELTNVINKQTSIGNSTKNLSDLNKTLTTLKNKIVTDRSARTSANSTLTTAMTNAVSAGVGLGTSDNIKCSGKTWKRTESVGDGKIIFCEPCTTKYVYNVSVQPTPLTTGNSTSYSTSCR